MTPLLLQEEHREARLTLRPPSLAAPYAPVQSWQHQPEKLIFESCGYEANVSCPGRLGPQCSSLLLRPTLPAPGGEGGSQLAWEKGIGRKSCDWSQMGWVTETLVSLSPATAHSTVSGLHADQRSSRDRIHTRRLCQDAGGLCLWGEA